MKIPTTLPTLFIIPMLILATACGKTEKPAGSPPESSDRRGISIESITDKVRRDREGFFPELPLDFTITGFPPGGPSGTTSDKTPLARFYSNGSIQAPARAPNMAVWVYRTDTNKLYTPKADSVSLSLADGYLPFPKARWKAGEGIEVRTELTPLIPEEKGERPLFLYRVQLFNASPEKKKAGICFAIRSFSAVTADGPLLSAGGSILALCPRPPDWLAEIPPPSKKSAPLTLCCFSKNLPAAKGEFGASIPACDLFFLLPTDGKPLPGLEQRDIMIRYAGTHTAWKSRDLLNKTKYHLPDQGLAETWRAALARLILYASDKGLDGDPLLPRSVRVGEIVSAAAALNRASRFRAARFLLEGFDKNIGPDGRALFGLADHYRFTRDKGWLEKKASTIINAADELTRLLEAESNALLSQGAFFQGKRDSAQTDRILYSDNFWALIGLEEAAYIASELGMPEKAERYGTQARNLGEALFSSIETAMDESGEPLIPEGPHGGMNPQAAVNNGAGAWPGSLLTYKNQRAARGFELYWKKWFTNPEGALFDGDLVLSEGMEMGLPLLSLRLKRYPQLILEWYGKHVTLPGAHTWKAAMPLAGTTAAAPESTAPSLRADAAYVTLLRNMFIMESGEYLFLAPGITLRWFGMQEEIGIDNAPTIFGNVSYRIRNRLLTTTIDLLNTTAVPPRGYKMNQIQPTENYTLNVDGKVFQCTNQDSIVIFPKGAKRIEIQWH